MKKETLLNAIQGGIALLFALFTLGAALVTLTWWYGVFSVIGFAVARVFYTDDEYGIESVKQYIHRKRGK